MKSDLLSLPSRMKTFEFIEKNPGVQVFEIAEGCDLPLSTVRQHLAVLTKGKLVTSDLDESTHRFFVWGTMAGRDRNMFWTLKRPRPRQIVEILFKRPNEHVTIQDLIPLVSINREYMGKILNFLVKRGIVTCERRHRKETFYSLKDPDTIREALEVIKGKTNLATHPITQEPDKASGTI